MLHRRRIGGVHLAVVVAAAPQLRQVLIGQVLDQRLQARIRAEEVLADEGAIGHRQALVVAVQRLVHLGQQHAVLVARQQVVPLARPDDLDDVPAGAAEGGLQLLDDLAVAAHRPVEALQVAVDDEDQVVEPLAGRQAQRAQRLRLVHLAVAQEAPDAAGGRVGDAACGQVAVESGLVDRVDRPEAHADGGELPEVGHQPRVRVRRQAARPQRLAPEVVELLLREPPLQEGARVDAGRGVALEVDLVAGGAVIGPAEEVVEADLVQAGGAGVGGQVPADPLEAGVGAQHHRQRVPADHAADPQLHRLVAGEVRLLLRRDGVDVAGLDQRRQAHVQLAGALEQLVDQVAGAVGAFLLDHGVERLDPLLGLGRVDVRQLLLELVEDFVHRAIHCPPWYRPMPPRDGSLA